MTLVQAVFHLLRWNIDSEDLDQGSESMRDAPHHTGKVNILNINSGVQKYQISITLARLRRHSSQARDVYFRPARLRFAVASSCGVGWFD